MINYIKSHKTIFIIIIVFIVIFLSLVIYQKINTKNTSSSIPSPILSTGASWNGIIPGVSTIKDITDAIGQPKIQDNNSLIYGSRSPTRDNIITIQNGTATLIKEIIAFSENRKTDEVTTKYGSADIVLYGPEAVNGNYLFVYLNKGIAYIGNPLTKSILEIWYFKPLQSPDDFQKNFAPNYNTSKTQGNF